MGKTNILHPQKHLISYGLRICL